jgi:hypothetical protein
MDAMFVDETKKVIRHFRDHSDALVFATEASSVSYSQRLARTPPNPPPRQCPPPQASPSRALLIPIESVAQAFFYNIYAIVGPTSSKVSPHSLQPSSAQCIIITAIGMAGLANSKRDSHLMVLARAKYDLSLRMVKRALQNLADALDEQTFVVIFMMSMFEVL